MSSYLYHLPSGIQSSVSGLSNSDLAYIQKGDWFPELSHLVKVTGPQDIDTNLDNRKFRDEGEKIDIFIHTALNPHTFVLETLGTFLEKKDLAILAATLQGFASIGRILKKSDLAPAYRRHLKDLKTHLTANLNLNHDADPSVQLFKLLCEQAESGKSDLISWSAVNTLQQLEYPESLRIDLLDKKPAEIEADILQKNISRLSNNDRLYGRDNPCQDREYIKFWVYGPTEILLSVCNGTYYFDVVQEVLRKSGMRGIRLALRGGNATAVREAVNFAGEIFNQFAANSQDKRYIDNKTRKKLVSLLLPYINHSDIELRNLVAEKLNDGSNGHEVSNNLLDSRNRAKVAIIDTTSSKKWQRVVALGDLSIPFLCEAIEGKLKFVVDENQNTNCQVEALKSIDKIINDIPIKVNTLFPYLSHSKDKIKLETFHLLKNYCTYLDDQSFKLLIQIALRILDWNLVISFGNRSIPFLCQILAGKTVLKSDEESNINCQIEALKSIDKIINDIPIKVNTLSPYLSHSKDKIKLETFHLLKNYCTYLDDQSFKLLIQIALRILDWNLVISFGNRSIPFLCQILAGKPRLKPDEASNVNCQIEALKSIDKIINDIPIKVNTLSPYLSHPKDKIKLETFHLLKNYWTYLDDQSIKLLIKIALEFFETWELVISFGDVSISVLCEIVEGKTVLKSDEASNINCQIEALKSIDKIINDIPRKVNTLSSYLSHPKDKIKLETFHLLKNYWTYLDDQSIKLLIKIALEFFETWELVISFGDVSISVLCEIVEGKTVLKSDEASNVNCQIEALKSIDKIIKEIPDKVARLSRYLQHDNDALRIKVANLLQPQKEYLDTNSKKIFTALLFDKVNLPKETEESENFENCLQKAKREELRIEEIFTKAIDACADSSVSTKAYLNKQKECLVNQIKEYSNSLELKLNCQKIDNLNKKINLSINIFNILISIATFSLGLLISQGRSNLFVIPTEFDSNSSYYYIYILLQLGILDIFLGLLFLLLWGFTYLINPTSDSFLLIPTSSCVIIGVFIILTLFIIFNLIGIIFTALSSIPGESFGFLLFVFILLILLNFYNEKPGCLLFVFIGVLIGIVWTGYKIMGKIFESLSSIPWKILFGISSSFSFFYLTFTILFIIFGFLLLRLESKAYVLQKEIENLENLAKNNLQ